MKQRITFLFLTMLVLITAVITVKTNHKEIEYEWTPYVVESGDCMWDIVNENAVIFKGQDVTSMCRVIAQENGMNTTQVYPGQAIMLPTAVKGE